MLTITIKQRLFGAIITSIVLTVVFLLLIQWSLKRGFFEYVNDKDRELVAAALIQAYNQQGSWNFLNDDPGQWPKVMSLLFPPWEAKARMIILDKEFKPILGNMRDSMEMSSFSPVRDGGNLLCYLYLYPKSKFSRPLNQRYLKRLEVTLVLISGPILLLSAIFSLVAARHLLRPIKALADGAHRLAAGDYSTRIPVVSSDELGRLAGDFNTMAMALDLHESTRNKMLSDISHELRTPLTILFGEILALKDGIRPLSPEAIHSLFSEIQHLKRLVEDLYQLSLYDTGTPAYHKEPLAPIAVMREIVDRFRPQFASKAVSLTTSFSSLIDVRVCADRERLYQLFSNLLDNSLKYTDAGGRTEIVAETGEDDLLIRVQDSAPSVPPEDMKRIFERLYRADVSRNRESGGAGLGLAICRKIAEAHQGTIEATQSPLGGLIITLSLPLLKDSPCPKKS